MAFVSCTCAHPDSGPPNPGTLPTLHQIRRYYPYVILGYGVAGKAALAALLEREPLAKVLVVDARDDTDQVALPDLAAADSDQSGGGGFPSTWRPKKAAAAAGAGVEFARGARATALNADLGLVTLSLPPSQQQTPGASPAAAGGGGGGAPATRAQPDAWVEGGREGIVSAAPGPAAPTTDGSVREAAAATESPASPGRTEEVVGFGRCLVALGSRPRPPPPGFIEPAARGRVALLGAREDGGADREQLRKEVAAGGSVTIVGSSWQALELACWLQQEGARGTATIVDTVSRAASGGEGRTLLFFVFCFDEFFSHGLEWLVGHRGCGLVAGWTACPLPPSFFNHSTSLSFCRKEESLPTFVESFCRNRAYPHPPSFSLVLSHVLASPRRYLPQGSGGAGASGTAGTCRMVFSDYAPLDHVLPRYLSVALLRRLNRRNIKTVGHSSLRWVGLASQGSFTPPAPGARLNAAESGVSGGGGAGAVERQGGDGLDNGEDVTASLRTGQVVLPPPASLSGHGLPGATAAAAEADAAVAAAGGGESARRGQAGQRRRRQQQRLQVMTAHSFDHLDTATHSTDRIVLAGVVRAKFCLSRSVLVFKVVVLCCRCCCQPLAASYPDPAVLHDHMTTLPTPLLRRPTGRGPPGRHPGPLGRRPRRRRRPLRQAGRGARGGPATRGSGRQRRAGGVLPSVGGRGRGVLPVPGARRAAAGDTLSRSRPP